jgi:hypothetical protein
MLLFLSYANEDGEVGREIAEQLRSEDVSVYASQDDARPADLATTDPERAIQRADAFLTLLSPDSLTSASCRRERELALRQERLGRDNGPGPDFVSVLKIRETPYQQAGSLQSRLLFDLTGHSARHRVISYLANIFAQAAGAAGPVGHAAGGGNDGKPRPPSPLFRNRVTESREIRDAISKQDSEHFWLLIAPPQLGKSWLLDEIADTTEKNWRGRWTIKLVDVRDLRPEIAGDADAILRMMFGLESQPGTGPADVSGIAASLIVGRKFHLCLLDSAELLDDGTIRKLRQYLGEINTAIVDAKTNYARLAVIVASRRDRGWKGIEPARGPEILRLTEFSVAVIEDALEKLAANMGRFVPPDQLHRHALLVHQLSEGLPALLAGCCDWIRAENWTGLDRLSEQSIFLQIAKPYVEDVLLSESSLRGSGAMPTAEHKEAIRQALRVLSTYRLYTQSHLSHLADDGELNAAMIRVGWSVEDLWAAVSGADLLFRPEWQPWMRIHRPIRRLLCRYWYPADVDRGKVNREARDFLQPFASGQPGSDQSVLLVECLWHQAQALLLDGSAELEEKLTGLASELSTGLCPNKIFNEAALRELAEACMTDDQELQEALQGVSGLFGRLVDAVLRPA